MGQSYKKKGHSHWQVFIFIIIYIIIIEYMVFKVLPGVGLGLTDIWNGAFF